MRTGVAVLAAAVLFAGCSSSSTVASSAGTGPGASASATTVAVSTSATVAATTAPPATNPPPTTPPPTTQPTTPVSTAQPTTSTVPASAPAHAKTIAGLLHLGRPIVLAHTGGEDQFPGSTLFAYGESMKAGVDVLDLNVLLSADGVLVIQHDDTVDRTSNGKGAVGDLTYAQLSQLDNAYWFNADCTCTGKPDSAYIYRGMRTGAVAPPAGYTPDDFTIPKLSDLITRYPDIPLNIEIKGSGAPAAKAAVALAQMLHDMHRADASAVTSFDDATVAAFHAAAPDIVVTPGLAATAAWVLGGTPLPDGMTILQLPPKFQDTTVITADSISKAHAAGYVIWVWPNDKQLENPASYRAFLAAGIDGLNINYPADGVAAVDAFSPPS